MSMLRKVQGGETLDYETRMSERSWEKTRHGSSIMCYRDTERMVHEARV